MKPRSWRAPRQTHHAGSPARRSSDNASSRGALCDKDFQPGDQLAQNSSGHNCGPNTMNWHTQRTV